MASTLSRPVRALGWAGWGVWLGLIVLLLGGCTPPRKAPLPANPDDTVAPPQAPEEPGSLSVDTTKVSLRLRYHGAIAPSLYRNADFLRAAAFALVAPGDSIKIGMTFSLKADAVGGRTISTKIEQATGSMASTAAGPWTKLAGHAGLPETVKRDSFVVARPTPGATWTYRACLRTERGTATPSAWLCSKAIVVSRPQANPAPPDTIVVDSSNVKVARLLTTPAVLDVVSTRPECEALSWDKRFVDAGQTTPVAACSGKVWSPADKDSIVKPSVVVICTYAQFLDGHWQLTTNSAGQARCKNEFGYVQRGQVIGALWAPGEAAVIAERVDGVIRTPADTLAVLPVATRDARPRS